MTWFGVATWIACVAAIAIAFRVVRAHTLPPAAPGAGLSSLSVVVPARNEAPRVGALVRSVLAQDHPQLTLVVVDDRSTDATREVALRAAAGDPRAQVLRVEERPAGWQGKLHALAAGVEAARGEWLLFLDADQCLSAPDVLRRLVAELERGDAAAVALIARNVRRHWWDRWWIQPMVNHPLVWGVILSVQRRRRASPWLVGSLGMRRATYDALGGAAAATRCAAGGYDDWGWAQSLAARGWRSRMVYVPELEDATNFESVRQVLDGLARWLAGLFSYRKGGWWAAAAIALALAGCLAAAGAVAAAALRGAAPDPGLLALAAVPPSLGAGYCLWSREPPWFAAAFFVVTPLVLVAIFSAAAARWRNQVLWRGDIMRVASDPPGPSGRPPGASC